MAKYVKQLDDGRTYEYGTVVQHAGKPDQMLREGLAPDYISACNAIGIVPTRPPTPPRT